jgi:hypothetical protein
LRERAYIRSLNYDKLAKQVNINLLDDQVAKEEALDAAIEAREFDQPLFDIRENEAQIDLPVTPRPLIEQASQVIR